MAGFTGRAKRISMGAAIADAMFVQRQHLMNCAVASGLHRCQLFRCKGIAHHNKAIPVKQISGFFHFVCCDQCKAFDARILRKVVALLCKSLSIPTAPAEIILRRVSHL